MIDTTFIIVFMIVVLLLILKVSLDIHEKFSTYLDHKSSCFSCEKSIINRCGPEYGWLGQSAKSFDSEFDLVTRTGDPSAGYGAKTLKYY